MGNPYNSDSLTNWLYFYGIKSKAAAGEIHLFPSGDLLPSGSRNPLGVSEVIRGRIVSIIGGDGCESCDAHLTITMDTQASVTVCADHHNVAIHYPEKNKTVKYRDWFGPSL